MITSIRLQNIQSHKDTTIEFTKGLNVIVGLSDAGKTAIMRAILWVLTGRPLGDRLLRRGAKQFSVDICLDDGHIVTKRKTTSANQYIVQAPGRKEEVLNAIGKSVPEEITRLFNIDARTQIHRQKSRPFLLDETSRDVSKFINEIARLSDIDDSLQWLNSDIRKHAQEETRSKAEYARLDAEYKSLAWVDTLLGFVEVLSVQEQRLARRQKKATDLRGAIARLVDATDEIEREQRIAALAGPLSQVRNRLQELKQSERKNDRLATGINRARYHSQEIANLSPWVDVKPRILALLLRAKNLREKRSRKEALLKQISIAQGKNGDIKECKEQRARLIASLPKVCKECGRPLP